KHEEDAGNCKLGRHENPEGAETDDYLSRHGYKRKAPPKRGFLNNFKQLQRGSGTGADRRDTATRASARTLVTPQTAVVRQHSRGRIRVDEVRSGEAGDRQA